MNFRSISKSLLAFTMAAGIAAASASTPTFARTSPVLDTRAVTAQKVENPAEEHYSSLDFFKYLVNRAEKNGQHDYDAERAVALLEGKAAQAAIPFTFKDGQPAPNIYVYTEIGAPGDCTSLDNLQKGLDLIKKSNELRATSIDPKRNGEKPAQLKVSSELMAMSQLNTNASRLSFTHSSAFNIGENLSWGSADPFSRWYGDEKVYYETGKVPAGSTVRSTGHYLNIVNSTYYVSGAAYSSLPVSKGTSTYLPHTNGQVFSGQNRYVDGGRTTGEYQKLLDEFMIYIQSGSSSQQSVQSEDSLQPDTSQLETGQKDPAPDDKTSDPSISDDGSPTPDLIPESAGNGDDTLSEGENDCADPDSDPADPSKNNPSPVPGNSDKPLPAVNNGSSTFGWVDPANPNSAPDSTSDSSSKWVKAANGRWNYLENGVKVTGRKDVFYNGSVKTFKFDASGNMITGWQQEGENRVRYTSDGSMKKNGWALIDGHWYAFNNQGHAVKGWYQDKSGWYYLNTISSRTLPEFAMQTGWLTLDGKEYYLDHSGKKVVGWVTLGDESHFFDNDGVHMKDTWIGSYYVNKKGVWEDK